MSHKKIRKLDSFKETSLNKASKNKENGRSYSSHMSSLPTILWSKNNGNVIRNEGRPKDL